MTKKELQEIHHKLKVLQHATVTGNVSCSCRYCGISRDTFYRWKQNYEQYGEKGLINMSIKAGTSLKDALPDLSNFGVSLHDTINSMLDSKHSSVLPPL